jgi:hypothetical protein
MVWSELLLVEYSSDESSSNELKARRIGEGEGEELKWLRRREEEDESRRKRTSKLWQSGAAVKEEARRTWGGPVAHA